MLDLHEAVPEPKADQRQTGRHEIHFPMQRPDEHVVMLLRRHWIILAHKVVHVFLLALIPPVLLTALFLGTDFEFIPGTANYVMLVEGVSIYYLFTLLSYFHHFIDYHLDIWIVTDQRVVSIEQQGLFNRVVSELNIGRIQDVTSEMKGKVQTFMHYGQVHIETAGNAERFVFEEVPHPDEVARLILQVHDRVAKITDLKKIREGEEYRHEIDKKEFGEHSDTKPRA